MLNEDTRTLMKRNMHTSAFKHCLSKLLSCDTSCSHYQSLEYYSDCTDLKRAHPNPTIHGETSALLYNKSINRQSGISSPLSLTSGVLHHE